MAEVVVLGVGSAGEMAVRLLSRGNQFEKIVAVDVRPERLKHVREQNNTPHLHTEEADLREASDLKRVCTGASIIINAAMPNYNMEIMDQALQQKAHYIDLAAMAYPDPEVPPPVLDQIKLDGDFQKQGLTAILGLGVAPGITNLLAAFAAQRYGSLDEVRIRVYGSGYAKVEGYALAPLFSPETFLDEVLYPAPVYENGKLSKLPPFSGHEVYAFPDKLGEATCYNVNNEETETLPRFVDPHIRFIDFKYAIEPERKTLIEGLYRIGLTGTKPIDVSGQKVVPFHVLLTLLPASDSVADRVTGYCCVVVDVVAGGGKTRHRFWTLLSHRDAMRQHGVSATAFLTGTPAAVAAQELQRGALTKRGVMSGGGLEVRPLLSALLRHDVPLFEGDPNDPNGKPLSV